MIEYETFRDLLPKNHRSMVSQELVDRLNEWDKDPKLVDSYRENLLSYTGVMKDGKFKLEDYVHAVKYVSYKLLGSTDIDAYAITFPDRYQRLIDEGLTRDGISPYAAAYKKNKLVNAIMEQTLVPSHVLNAPLHQQALNELAQIMVYSKSDIARVNAATSILANTKQPEKVKIELDLGVSTSVVEDYEVAMNAMVQKQMELIAAGGDLKAIANASIKAKVIDTEVVE